MTEIIDVAGATGEDVEEAVEAALDQIDAGLVVGLPTDTVYVLACDPTDPGATDRLFSLKARPRTRDLSVIVGSREQAESLATAVPEAARTLMDRFWPGPLTLVLPRNPEEPLDLGDDEATVGVRMPDHALVLDLCLRAGPLAAAPAGLEGESALETADDIVDEFGEWVPLVLDGGRCEGTPPTVVDATGEEPHLLREGPVPWSAVAAEIGLGEAVGGGGGTGEVGDGDEGDGEG